MMSSHFSSLIGRMREINDFTIDHNHVLLRNFNDRCFHLIHLIFETLARILIPLLQITGGPLMCVWGTITVVLTL